MCGRYRGPSAAEIYASFLGQVAPFREPPPLLDIRPTDPAPIFAKGRNGEVTLQMMRWGLIPSFHKGAVKDWKATTFNARLEDISRKPAFNRPWATKRRALIPADSYWEWTGERGSKQRWEVRRADNQPLAFAGLWDHARIAEGDILSFTMLTRAPGLQMRELHDREPVILNPDDWSAWLDGSDDIDLALPWLDGAFLVQAY